MKLSQKYYSKSTNLQFFPCTTVSLSAPTFHHPYTICSTLKFIFKNKVNKTVSMIEHWNDRKEAITMQCFSASLKLFRNYVFPSQILSILAAVGGISMLWVKSFSEINTRLAPISRKLKVVWSNRVWGSWYLIIWLDFRVPKWTSGLLLFLNWL